MGRDKALVEVEGVPMARRVADALVAGGCAPVVLIGGRASALSALGLPVVPDRFPGEGPLGGVLTALAHAASLRPAPAPAPAVLVAACDLPALSATGVRALVDRARAGDDVDACVAVACGDRREPALAVWHPSCAAPLRAAFDRGERALHRALCVVRVAEVRVDADAVRNVNTPGDLGR
jgi:molybdopterin-guanine dinucleotide biosynthesis protein A